ncbi:motA/TolQ/ExbB proton channel family protein, partial [Vibrio parahaemolyticus VPTS-2010_2]
SFKQSM